MNQKKEGGGKGAGIHHEEPNWFSGIAPVGIYFRHRITTLNFIRIILKGAKTAITVHIFQIFFLDIIGREALKKK